MSRLRLAIALAAIALSCQSGGPASPDPGGETPVVRVDLSVDALSLGADSDAGTVTLLNQGTATIDWRIAAISNGWISVVPSSGRVAPGGQAVVSITIDRGGLSTGTHVGTVQIEAGDRTLSLSISVEQPGTPIAELDPSALDLGESGSGEARVSNVGDGALEWTLEGPEWVVLQPASGTLEPGGEAVVAVVPDREALDPGSHTGTLSLESDGGDATATVTVDVPRPATLRLSTTAIDLGEAATAATFVVFNDGEGPLHWTAAEGAGWLALEPASGTVGAAGAQAVTVRASRAGLDPGAHQATLSVDSNGGEGRVAVSIRVAEPAGGGDGGGSGGDDGSGDDGGSGGDGGGGGGNPGTTALSGRIVDQFSGSGVAGLTVHFDHQDVVTGGDGTFHVQGAPSGSPRPLKLSSGSTYTRQTFARTGDGTWRVIPKTFDMAAFDDVAREYEPRTIRWVNDPHVYFDVTPSAGFPQGSELDTWIQEVQGVIQSFISGWTNGTIRAASFTVGTSPPQTGSPGSIVIGFSEDPSIYNDPRTVGLARTFWTVDRSIYSARIWLRFGLIQGPGRNSTRVAVVGHELGHALGVGHMDGRTASLMTPSISVSGLTTFDRRAGDVLYSRSPGNTNPDSDDQSLWRGLVAAAAGVHEWVCDPPPDGAVASPAP